MHTHQLAIHIHAQGALGERVAQILEKDYIGAAAALANPPADAEDVDMGSGAVAAPGGEELIDPAKGKPKAKTKGKGKAKDASDDGQRPAKDSAPPKKKKKLVDEKEEEEADSRKGSALVVYILHPSLT